MSEFSQNKPRNHELPKVPSWSSAYLTAISHPTSSAVPREILQLATRSITLFWRECFIERFSLQFLANRSLMSCHLSALIIAIDHAFLCHSTFLSYFLRARYNDKIQKEVKGQREDISKLFPKNQKLAANFLYVQPPTAP